MTFRDFSWNFSGLAAKIEPPALVVPYFVSESDGFIWMELPTKRVTPPDDLLLRFSALHRLGVAGVLKYACRWGLPNINGEGVPQRRLMGSGDGHRVESVLCLSRRMDAGLEVLDSLRQSKPGSASAWAVLFDPDPEVYIGGGLVEMFRGFDTGILSRDLEKPEIRTRVSTLHLADLKHQRGAIETVLSAFLRWADVRPAIRWPEDSLAPTVDLVTSDDTHFGCLAIQMAWGATDIDWLDARCSECHKAYRPTRQPNRSKRNYCPECRDSGAPTRAAAKAYRERKAHEKPKR